MAASLKTFSHFVRERVVGPPPELTAAQAEAVKIQKAEDEKKDQLEASKEAANTDTLWNKTKYTKKKYDDLKRKMKVDSEAIEPKRMRMYEEDYGAYKFDDRYNVDQVPFLLDNNPNKSFFSVDDQKCQISGQPGADKRFGTLQVNIV